MTAYEGGNVISHKWRCIQRLSVLLKKNAADDDKVAAYTTQQKRVEEDLENLIGICNEYLTKIAKLDKKDADSKKALAKYSKACQGEEESAYTHIDRCHTCLIYLDRKSVV